MSKHNVMSNNYSLNLYKDESKNHVSTNRFFLEETHHDRSFPASHFSYNIEGPHKWPVNSYHMFSLKICGTMNIAPHMCQRCGMLIVGFVCVSFKVMWMYMFKVLGETWLVKE